MLLRDVQIRSKVSASVLNYLSGDDFSLYYCDGKDHGCYPDPDQLERKPTNQGYMRLHPEKYCPK